jgi:hypothetical protein
MFDQILTWAVDHHRRYGTWPTDESGPIAAAQGEIWKGVAMALRFGYAGGLTSSVTGPEAWRPKPRQLAQAEPGADSGLEQGAIPVNPPLANPELRSCRKIAGRDLAGNRPGTKARLSRFPRWVIACSAPQEPNVTIRLLQRQPTDWTALLSDVYPDGYALRL